MRDTNDFLKKLGELGTVPENAIIYTIDAIELYPHVPHDEGLEALRKAVDRGLMKIPTTPFAVRYQ